MEAGKMYSLQEAVGLLKQVNTTSFDSSVDLHLRLGVDPKKADQAIRGAVTLPHGTGKDKKVLVLCPPEKEEEAKKAGADYYGLNEYIEKINKGWTDVDVVIATPSVMPQIAKLGKVLGPRNLMPNPKSGTVTENVANAVEEVKKGKIVFKVDQFGIIHSSIGRISFSPESVVENALELILTVAKLKPASTKGDYFKSITMVTSMSPAIAIDSRSLNIED